jgi:hypothetical protein
VVLEVLVREARDDGLRAQVDPVDRDVVAVDPDADLRGGLDALGLVARLREDVRERHREAAGVRGADELLGVRALAVLEAGGGGEVAADAGAGLHPFAPVLEVAVPFASSDARH